MYSRIFILTIVAILLGAAAPDDKRITQQQMERLFLNMRISTPWDTNAPLLWGYFFTDPDTSKLERAAEKLGRDGYRVVAIRQAKNRPTQFLHVERLEHHTPDSLHRRNLEFYALAESLGLESYDGMDVGPPPPAD